MISSVDGFYIMDTEPVHDNYPCLLYKIFVHKTLCRIQCGTSGGLGCDSVHGCCGQRGWWTITSCASVLGSAECLHKSHSCALFGNLTLKLMSNNGSITQLQTLFECLDWDTGLCVQLMEGLFIPSWYLKVATGLWDGWHGRIWSLESQLCRPGMQLPCVHGGPYKSDILALSSWKDGGIAGKREVKCSWVLLTSRVEIYWKCSKGLQVWEICLNPHSWDIVSIIAIILHLVWSWVQLLIYLSRLDNRIIPIKVLCCNHKLQLNKNMI